MFLSFRGSPQSLHILTQLRKRGHKRGRGEDIQLTLAFKLEEQDRSGNNDTGAKDKIYIIR